MSGSKSKRPWRQFPGRFLSEANSASGVFGLAGAGVGIAAGFLAAPIVSGLGAVVAIGTTAYCIIRAIPLKHLSAESLVGVRIDDLSIISNISPKVEKIGFIGPSRVGKTTLLSHISAQTAPQDIRTDNIYAVITILSGGLPVYFALIDGAGQRYAQQFRIAKEADHIVICLDHNISDTDPNIDDDRLVYHKEFISQLSDYLRGEGKQLRHIHFILNKRDLYEKSETKDRLLLWIEDQIRPWRMSQNIKISYAMHSNFVSSDTTNAIKILHEWAK